jgi:hypothetical protein
VDSSAPATMASPKSPRPRKSGPNEASSLTVINSALLGVGSVFLTTHSILVTLIAAISAVILGGFALIAH